MSKIPTLTNIDRAEPRHPEKSKYIAAAKAVHPAGRPQQQTGGTTKKDRNSYLFYVFRLKPRQKVVIRC